MAAYSQLMTQRKLFVTRTHVNIDDNCQVLTYHIHTYLLLLALVMLLLLLLVQQQQPAYSSTFHPELHVCIASQ